MQGKKKKTKKISIQLLVVVHPDDRIFIIAVGAIVLTNASRTITEQAKQTLEENAASSANDIGSIMQGIAGYYDGL